ncbi:MAG: hypothetical protein OXH99_00160 [Bryobacterales bacterium]|nr:hypothetical protein [Bryobacterales bacterium]
MLLIIAAASHELAGLPGLVRHRSPDVRWIASATIRGQEATLVANGAGRRAVSRGARALLARRRFRGIVSAGFAGALDPGLDVGEVLVADRILHGGHAYPARIPSACPPGVRSGALLTADEVIGTARAKRDLARGGARAVDMEAAAVARLAAVQKLPFYCVRSISDGADEDLPVDFNRALRADGSLSMWRVIRQAGCRPGAWRRLLGLARNAGTASRSLAECLTGCEFGA